MLIGYARVSTKDQNLNLQVDALKEVGCSTIFNDVVSGTKSDRQELLKMLDYAREGDTIVVWKLDRLGRSLKDLVNIVNDLEVKGVQFKSIQDNIDTSNGIGKFFFHVFGAIAEFERDMIRERTMAGLTAARARGKIGGRPKGLSKEAENKARIAESLYKEGNLSVSEIAKTIQVSRDTLYRYLRYRNVKI